MPTHTHTPNTRQQQQTNKQTISDFKAQVADGRVLAGRGETYHGSQALAYCEDPAEHVAYTGCHDNE
jgi:hypothetical protein